jgi:aryl-alcohol dehydrogenase-like predicted oxidoreductase
MEAEDLLCVTGALLQPETALAAVRALRGSPACAAVEGLAELIYHPRTAQEAVAAIAALEPIQDPLILGALHAALNSPHSSVRLAALQDLHRRQVSGLSGSLGRVLRRDESWPVRRAALHLLATEPGPERWRVLDAATDPHWRVRHALIRVLLRWGGDEVQLQEEIDRLLTCLGTEARVRGLRAYLHYRWTGRPLETVGVLTPMDPSQSCPFWDWDAAVLLRTLEHMEDRGRRQDLHALPLLLTHPDERIRALCRKTVRAWGDVRHLATIAGLLDEPRQEGIGEIVKLLSELDDDRTEELARFLLRQSEATPAQLAWALDQVGIAFPVEEEEEIVTGLVQQAAAQPPVIRCALAGLAARWEHAVANDWLKALLADSEAAVRCEALRGLNRRPRVSLDPSTWRRLLDPEHAGLRAEVVTAAVRQGCEGELLEVLAADADVRVRVRLAECLAPREDSYARSLSARLQADAHPHVRAAALTPTRAAELVSGVVPETSWHVLATAARLARVPLWKLEPAPPWRPDPLLQHPVEPLRLRAAAPTQVRRLGPDGLAITPLGISGHYGLPVEGFVRAYEAGVNLMFWEPNYRTLTEFLGRVGPAIRDSIHILAGTFEADGARIRRDAERVLRTLRIERISTFLLFWVQSWARVTPDVRESLERLKAQGKIAAFGLSTHSRALAMEALDTGWDPVMVRHSAAHRGAEEQIFPRAAERGTSLITFSNTCYGRLLEPREGLSPPSAADCYRYALMQPGVRACLSAPATLAQLEENLAALHDPILPAERRKHLQALGERLYEEETLFRQFVRFL